MLRIEHHPNGPRVYVLKLRVHHGLAGCALVLIGAARRSPLMVELGLALVLSDAHDFPWPVRERCFTVK